MDLALEQHDLELESIDRGIVRYNQLRERNDPLTLSPEQSYICKGVHMMTEGLKLEIAKMEKSSHRSLHLYALLVSVPPEQLSLITLKAIFSHPERKIREMAPYIAGCVRTQREFLRIKETAPDVYKKITTSKRKLTPRIINLAKKAADAADERWETGLKWKLGAFLINTAVEYTGFCKYVSKRNGVNQFQEIVLDEEIEKDIERQHQSLEFLTPVYLPMVVPPKPWTSMSDGGFVFHKVTLVKQGWMKDEHDKFRETHDLSRVYRAINALQDTAWSINPTVLRVLKELYLNEGGGVAGLPGREPQPLPPKPDDIETNKQSRAEWKLRASRVYDYNASESSKRKSVLFNIWTAEKFLKYPQFYFVWQLDWRGRAYPCSTFLHPQGDDVARGLLRFAEAKPLGEDGFYWLSIHLANCIGWDKIPNDERYRLVNEQHAKEIQRWVDDPMAFRGWMEADAPFQTLAAAEEWVKARKDKTGFLSRIPVQMDGLFGAVLKLRELRETLYETIRSRSRISGQVQRLFLREVHGKLLAVEARSIVMMMR